MCGLFGAFQPNGISPDDCLRADRARDSLYHRGPDDAGSLVTDGLYHGFRRLSIIDLSKNGHQPMVSSDGAVAITVNGEIYNHAELRTDLIRRGHVFASRSDSEVVLHGYREWGLARLCERLEGMYAAVVHDRRSRTLHAFRDRPGMKPFFYFHSNREFAWASELKALEAWLAGRMPPYDNTAILDFLAFRYIPAPKTLYRDIWKLPPANHLTFDLERGSIDIRRYWDVPMAKREGSDEELAAGWRDRVQASVASHMVSDVPVGYFLSGGVDSSAILSHAVKVNPDATAYSIGYDDPDFDESRFAAITAKRLNAKHRIRILQPSEVDDVFERTREWYDEPFSDKGAVPAFRVSEFARKEVTVVLTGDGGDEMMGGYRWYRRFNGVRRMQRFLGFGSPAGWNLSNRQLRMISIREPMELYPVIRSGRPRWERDVYRERLGIPADYDELWHLRPWWKPDLGPFRSLQYLDFHTNLHNNILTKVDRVTMSVALEARIPILDRSVIEYAFSLPTAFTLRSGQLKGGLKFAYKGIVPDEILTRKKQGFGLPQSWKRAAMDTQGQDSYQEALLGDFVQHGKLDLSVGKAENG